MKKELIEQYIAIINKVNEKTSKLNDALVLLNEDNYIMSLIPQEFDELLTALLTEHCGDEALDWITWWLYETDQKSSKIWIDKVEHQVNSFDDLWELVLKEKTSAV